MRCRNRVLVALGCVFLGLGTLVGGGYYCARRYSYPLSVFQDCAKFYTDYKQKSLRVVNLGTMTAKYAFDWSAGNVRGGNFAMAPQCGTLDFALLKRFERFLAPGAVVMISLCPFSGLCAADYPRPDDGSFAKYYAVLAEKDMPYFSWLEACRVWMSLNILNRDWKNSVRNDRSLNDDSSASLAMRSERVRWLESDWKRLFTPECFNVSIPSGFANIYKYNLELYRRMVNWCYNRGYQPVFIFLPISPEFDRLLSDGFRQRNYYDFAKAIDASVPIYDYMRDPLYRSNDCALFLDGYCLNKSGRVLFTREVVRHLIEDGFLKR